MSPVRCSCEIPPRHVARRVVLTGGPGAGKTAVLEVVRRRLCDHVRVVPEAATIVFGGGFPRSNGVHARAAAQLAIYHVQDQLERMTVADPTVAVCLCDRGVIDGLAYWPGAPEDFFRDAATTREQCLARYHAVIHLRTPNASDGYNHANAVRTETAAEAHAIDERIEQVWRDHPRRFFVESSHDFIDKLSHTLQIIESELPECCGIHLGTANVRPSSG